MAQLLRLDVRHAGIFVFTYLWDPLMKYLWIYFAPCTITNWWTEERCSIICGAVAPHSGRFESPAPNRSLLRIVNRIQMCIFSQKFDTDSFHTIYFKWHAFKMVSHQEWLRPPSYPWSTGDATLWHEMTLSDFNWDAYPFSFSQSSWWQWFF